MSLIKIPDELDINVTNPKEFESLQILFEEELDKPERKDDRDWTKINYIAKLMELYEAGIS